MHNNENIIHGVGVSKIGMYRKLFWASLVLFLASLAWFLIPASSEETDEIDLWGIIFVILKVITTLAAVGMFAFSFYKTNGKIMEKTNPVKHDFGKDISVFEKVIFWVGWLLLVIDAFFVGLALMKVFQTNDFIYYISIPIGFLICLLIAFAYMMSGKFFYEQGKAVASKVLLILSVVMSFGVAIGRTYILHTPSSELFDSTGEFVGDGDFIQLPLLPNMYVDTNEFMLSVLALIFAVVGGAMIYIESKRYMNSDFRKLIRAHKSLQILQDLVTDYRNVIDKSHIKFDNLLSNADDNFKTNQKVMNTNCTLLTKEMKQILVTGAKRIGVDVLESSESVTGVYDFGEVKKVT